MAELDSEPTLKKVIQGSSLKGSYLGGVYYPDKTKVGLVEEWLSRILRQKC